MLFLINNNQENSNITTSTTMLMKSLAISISKDYYKSSMFTNSFNDFPDPEVLIEIAKILIRAGTLHLFQICT